MLPVPGKTSEWKALTYDLEHYDHINQNQYSGTQSLAVRIGQRT